MNRALPSLHAEPLELTRKVPLKFGKIILKQILESENYTFILYDNKIKGVFDLGKT